MACNLDCTCVRCTVVFGQQLANVFHTWFELSLQAKEHLKGVLCDIDSGTLALQQLEGIIEQDKVAPQADGNQIFTKAGRESIEALATKCNLLFKAVIWLLQKAVDKKASECSDHDGDDDDEKEKDEEEGNKSDLLIGLVPDPSSMSTMALIRHLSDWKEWRWLGRRITRCREQLRWVRQGLHLHVQIGRLARLQAESARREIGAFESEAVARGSIQLIRDSQVQHLKRQVRKQERAERRRARHAKKEAEADGDASSTRSSVASSRASAKTAVEEQTPPVVEVGGDNSGIPNAVPVPEKTSAVIASTSGAPRAESLSSSSSAGTDDSSSDEGPDEVARPDRIRKAAESVSSSLNKMNQKLSDTMAEWTHSIFGKDDEFSRDWESQELEAWVTRGIPGHEPIKVPFGHRRLQYGLKTTRSARKKPMRLSTFNWYLDQGPRMHAIVDDVVQVANRLQKRERVCLAFAELVGVRNPSSSFTIVFFSIRAEKPPIKMTDPLGRKLTIPFEIAKSWENMMDLIDETLLNVPGLGFHINEGHYDFINARGEAVPPSLWESNVKPGEEVKMKLWPLESHPLPDFYSTYKPLLHHNYRARHADLARQARAQKLRQRLQPAPLSHAGPPPPLAPLRPNYRFGRPDVRGLGTSVDFISPSALGRRPFPGAGPSMPPPPPPPMMVPPQQRRRRAMAWFGGGRNRARVDIYALTDAEVRELTFVDFAEELERAKRLTVAELLKKLTTLRDVVGGCSKGLDLSGPESDLDNGWGSDTDTDTDTDTGSDSDSSSVSHEMIEE